MKINKLHAFKYLPAFSIPVCAYFGFILGGWFSWLTPLFTFGFLPLLELFLKPVKSNIQLTTEKNILNNPLFDTWLFVMVPIQFGLLYLFLQKGIEHHLNFLQYIGQILSMGILCGVIGINVAHELGHRKGKSYQIAAKLLLLSSLYQHFIIEHYKGHHKNVATQYDAATALRGESVYKFWLRSVVGSYLSAWNIEKKRLLQKNMPVYSLQNQMLQFLIQGTTLIFIIIFNWGVMAGLSFILAAIVGILLLETVNYLEHYGLLRIEKPTGFERVKHYHSWNSNHIISRLVLFELSRHSDHHYQASRPYPILRHVETSPQLPAGYPAMMLVALFPPLWFRIMHPKLDNLKNSTSI